jgi:hypothetical protein
MLRYDLQKVSDPRRQLILSTLAWTRWLRVITNVILSPLLITTLLTARYLAELL